MVSKEVEGDLKSEALKLRSMILNSAKAKRDRKQKGLMYMDINIASQRKSALIDTGASDLFISRKDMGKLGLSVRKSTKKIKIVNSKKVLIVEVAQGVEL
ncbi:hypothetical protein GOBAR_AA22485 [Gossypium barbadense]|uniref:Peptidase A2 domain-containing protein n=1 Tax=Gossypium barbadense TaxID=3634 RepID=A0A2P5X4C1_GOSBA|nr:hypothetical protein GOBAR_AA22485 [Gossypium barbadense]